MTLTFILKNVESNGHFVVHRSHVGLSTKINTLKPMLREIWLSKGILHYHMSDDRARIIIVAVYQPQL